MVWAGHTRRAYGGDERADTDVALWKASVRDHERLVNLIESGDGRVAAFALRHLEACQAYISNAERDTVSASTTAGRSW